MKYDELSQKEDGEKSEDIRRRVIKAREIQLKRYSEVNIFSNASMTQRHIKKYCQLDNPSEKILKRAIESLALSARAYNRILKVSRTIADLEGKKNIEISHISEAIQYRSLDRKYV